MGAASSTSGEAPDDPEARHARITAGVTQRIPDAPVPVPKERKTFKGLPIGAWLRVAKPLHVPPLGTVPIGTLFSLTAATTRSATLAELQGEERALEWFGDWKPAFERVRKRSVRRPRQAPAG